MFSVWALVAHVLALLALVNARSSTGDSVLVVLDSAVKKEDYSIFFDGLKDKGYKLTFRAPKDVSPTIIEDGVPSFSHVVLFAPEAKSFASDITPQTLVNLLSLDTNLLLTLSTKQTILTSLATEFSLILPPPGTPLISHFPVRSDPAHVIPITPVSNPIISSPTSPIWFSGISHALGNNPLLVPILKAPEESFAADSEADSGADTLVEATDKGGEGLWAGNQMGVVTGFQAKTGARVAWVGGISVFSDEFAKKEASKGVKSGNEQFAQDVAAWTFKESLVLRIDNATHHREGETTSREQYTTNDQIVFTTYISKFNPKTSVWEPFSGLKDLQLEFTMLDPHIRTALPALGADKPGAYQVSFRAPDRHGVFKFIVDYNRKGWSHLYSSTVVPVVPPRHDEYPRFLSAAWPYYAGAISTSVAFLLFSALWLAGDDRGSLSKKVKGKKAE